MKIDLSTEDWAGVLSALHDRIDWQRNQATEDEGCGYDALAHALRENADDLERIAKSLSGQVSAPPLEQLHAPADLDPEDDDAEVICSHVWTASEVLAMRDRDAEHNAKGRELHGDKWHGYTRTYPEPGTTCNADVLFWELEPMMRYGRWRDGVIVLGDSKFGDGGENDDVNCNNGHYFAWPDEVDYL